MTLKQKLKAMWLILMGWGVCVNCDLGAPLTVDFRRLKKQYICNNRIWQEDDL